MKSLPSVLALLTVLALVVGACGTESAGSATGSTDITGTTTETVTTTETTATETSTEDAPWSSSEEESTTPEESTDYVPEDDYSEEEDENYGEDDYATDWDSALPGVWVAPQPYGGEELWTFNGNTGGATWNFWPRGVGVGNPLDNGVPAPINIGHLYSVDGDTLSVHSALSSRTYYNLTELDTDCFSADFDGDTITFCRWTG